MRWSVIGASSTSIHGRLVGISTLGYFWPGALVLPGAVQSRVQLVCRLAKSSDALLSLCCRGGGTLKRSSFVPTPGPVPTFQEPRC